MKGSTQYFSAAKQNKVKLRIFIGIVVFTVLTITSSYVIRNNVQQDVRTKAVGPVCDDRCVHELDCCKAIKANDDPYECSWPDRGWCFPSTCAPYNGQHTNCGWYWKFHYTDDPNGLGTNTVNGYGCMIGPDEGSMRLICGGGGKPSNTPKPTQPRVSNTPKPPKPTNSPIPTTTGVPTASPTDSFTIPSDNTHLRPTSPPEIEPTQSDNAGYTSYPTQGNYPIQIPDFEERPMLQVQVSPTSVPKFNIPLFDVRKKIINSFQIIKNKVFTFFITILP